MCHHVAGTLTRLCIQLNLPVYPVCFARLLATKHACAANFTYMRVVHQVATYDVVFKSNLKSLPRTCPSQPVKPVSRAGSAFPPPRCDHPTWLRPSSTTWSGPDCPSAALQAATVAAKARPTIISYFPLWQGPLDSAQVASSASSCCAASACLIALWTVLGIIACTRSGLLHGRGVADPHARSIGSLRSHRFSNPSATTAPSLPA